MATGSFDRSVAATADPDLVRSLGLDGYPGAGEEPPGPVLAVAVPVERLERFVTATTAGLALVRSLEALTPPPGG